MTPILNVVTDEITIFEKYIEDTSESFSFFVKFGEFILYILPLVLAFIAILIAFYLIVIVITNLRMNYRIKNEAFEKISRLDVFRINQHIYKSSLPKWDWIPEEPTEFTYDNYDIIFDPQGINLYNKNYENHYRFIPKTDVKGLEQGGDVLYVELINHDDVFLTFDSIEECKSKVKEIQQLFYKANNEQLFDPFTSHCKRCGCSWNNACEGGCYWFDEWICSSCATEEELKSGSIMGDIL